MSWNKKIDVLISIKDGERKVITRATNYGVYDDRKCAWVQKNGCTIFFLFSEIKYIGKLDEIE